MANEAMRVSDPTKSGTPIKATLHTPAPWSVERTGGLMGGQLRIKGPDGETIASMCDHRTGSRAEADAYVMAAGPNLIAVCEELASLMRGPLGICTPKATRDRLSAAIRKVRS